MLILDYIKRPKWLIEDISRLGRFCLNTIRAGGLFLLELALIPLLWLLCIDSRRAKRPIQVGLGPQPLINNIHHKKALVLQGYTAENFVHTDNFISDAYDLNLAQRPWSKLRKGLYLFIRALYRYRCLFIYFDGGPLSLFDSVLLHRIEPHFYKLAGIKTVVMPFGMDIQSMLHNPNLYFKHTLTMDYPKQTKRFPRVSQNVIRWTQHANWVISGCEWVDYMYHWNTLQLAHFSIDMAQWKASENSRQIADDGPLKILHAPNHASIKGTPWLLKAIEKLQAEGYQIELVLMQGIPNDQIRETIESVDLVADQFVIGWYALFAIESMALGKPVLCYVRPDFLEMYTHAGLLEKGELPVISANVMEIEETLRHLYANREELRQRASLGRTFVKRHHSLEAIGGDFADILKKLGYSPVNASGLAR